MTETRITDEERIFTAAPDNKAAATQINKALNGENGAISGVQGSETSLNQQEEKKKQERERASFSMTSEQIAQAYAEMGEAIVIMQEHIHEMGESLAVLSQKSNEILVNIDDGLTEIGEKLSRQKDELRNLEEGLNSSVDKEYQLALIDLKKAEIDHTESVQNLYKELKESTEESLAQAKQDFDIAQTTLSELQELKHAAETSGNIGEHLEELTIHIAIAEQNAQNAQRAIESIATRAEFTSNILESSAQFQMESFTCSSIEDEIKKIEMTQARTELINELTTSIQDGEISQAQGLALMALSTKAGVTKEEQINFAKGVAKAGIIIQTPEGPLTGTQAQSYILSEFDNLRQEKTQELNETQEHLINATEQQEKLQTEITNQTQILDETTASINDITTKGSASEIAAAKLGIAIIGDNQSYLTSVIKDINGNEVHIDDSNNTYYHLGESGERVYYDPVNDKNQILNFSMGKNGDAPMMSQVQTPSILSSLGSTFLSSAQMPAPVSRFANIDVNTDASLMRYNQINAASSIKSGELTFATLTADIDNLKQKATLIGADIDKINEIEQQLSSGQISIEDANNQLNSFKEENSKWASSDDFAMNTPKFGLAEYDKTSNEALSIVENAAINNGIISQLDYDRISQSPTMPAGELDALMVANNVRLEGEIPQNNPKGIYANGLTLGSVLDDYPQYNEPNASYLAPVNNGVDNVASLTANTFDQTAQNTSDLTQEQLKLEEEQRITLQQQIDAKNNVNFNSTPNNAGMIG